MTNASLGPVIPFDFACEHGGKLLVLFDFNILIRCITRQGIISKEASTSHSEECVATTSGRVSSFLTIIYYYFYVRYGGGPLVTSLETCEKCNVSKCSLVISH